ncbi:MAG: 4-hydroxy-tetrahydrodipicolinate reductase, partial [Thermonemataceae bacterium]|nr:4-hydroxy-tetrahydrodipicolinate reductase [Thermonemataceae bacterium]
NMTLIHETMLHHMESVSANKITRENKMTAIRVLVNGAAGRMGQTTVKAITNDPDLILIGQTGSTDNLAAAIKENQAQVVVDFTNAEVAAENTQVIIDAGAHPVIGTSGLLPEQIKHFQEQCKKLKLGGIIAPNFSLGAVLMMKHAQEIVKYFPHVEIIEMHHDKKVDSPSGTAMRTAEMLLEANPDVNQSSFSQKEMVPGARGANYQHIPIHAVRLPGFIAHQQIIFGDIGETLTLRHDSTDRQCFMPGVALACEKVVQLEHLVYGLEKILG